MVNFEEFMKVVGSKGLKSHPDMVEELEEALKVSQGHLPTIPGMVWWITSQVMLQLPW